MMTPVFFGIKPKLCRGTACRARKAYLLEDLCFAAKGRAWVAVGQKQGRYGGTNLAFKGKQYYDCLNEAREAGMPSCSSPKASESRPARKERSEATETSTPLIYS